MSGLGAPQPRRKADGESIPNLVLVAILALGCGFLSFNFGQILTISREVIHESLAQQHHLQHEYCSYTKCTLNKHHSRKDAFGLLIGKANSLEEQERLDSLMFPAPPAETVRALSTRACEKEQDDGDGVKCLEGSPTNRWFEEYYRLGHRHWDLDAYINKAGDFEGTPLQKGLGRKTDSVEACAAECLQLPSHLIPGPLQMLPCNAFSYCAEERCYEAGEGERKHVKGDCWLQFIEAPAAPLRKYRGAVSSSSQAHVLGTHGHGQWWGGVLLPRGLKPANTTFVSRVVEVAKRAEAAKA
ncbi:hypothetical protein FOA52_003442 [Chlamydomonas sp. UWO 241]|nr:hypothetical protein FOA52_003442 [Chlamydomonas sp. UWO 241]